MPQTSRWLALMILGVVPAVYVSSVGCSGLPGVMDGGTAGGSAGGLTAGGQSGGTSGGMAGGSAGGQSGGAGGSVATPTACTLTVPICMGSDLWSCRFPRDGGNADLTVTRCDGGCAFGGCQPCPADGGLALGCSAPTSNPRVCIGDVIAVIDPSLLSTRIVPAEQCEWGCDGGTCNTRPPSTAAIGTCCEPFNPMAQQQVCRGSLAVQCVSTQSPGYEPQCPTYPYVWRVRENCVNGCDAGRCN